MRTLLAAINAKFSHTNLAVRYLKNTLDAAGIPAEFAEYTINQPMREILTDLARYAPDVLLFSCYLWNIETIRKIGADFRLLFPKAKIILGGPEVSFDAEEQLSGMPWADAIISGEGEPVIAAVLREESLHGVFYADRFAELDLLPFPYHDLSDLSDRVLYYESTRGCPFGCSYCLSSADRAVRYRSLPLVFEDLGRFLAARVMRVKFVDRTFNLDGERALAIWRFLAEQDNGITSFQMELGGDLLTEEQIAFLAGVRSGLFQFEIGVQSTCETTLAEICRKTDIERLFYNISAIRAAGNIHQHLDLIAGLPLEDYTRFAKSYDEVLSLRPQQLQLGFLKLLRGSTLYQKRANYRLIYSETPPYEILQTPWLPFADLARLKIVEEMTEVYYNSGRFSNTLEYCFKLVSSPFETMVALGETMPAHKIGKYEYYDYLYAFCVSCGGDPVICRGLLWYDLCLHERPRGLPTCLAADAPMRERCRAPHSKTQYATLFRFNVTSANREPDETALLFDYEHRAPDGRASCKRLNLQETAKK